VEEKWNRNDPCPEGVNTPFNIDAKINGAYIAIGLLFGDGAMDRTMEIATRCGQDSDCNPSSAAGILGVMTGYDRIPEMYKANIPALADRKFAFTDYSFNDIVRSTEARALEAISRAGGSVSDSEVVVRRQSPRPPRLEQWSPGIPDRRVNVSEAAWKWQGSWTADDEARVSSRPGDIATFTFEGVAVALLGRLDQSGGRAEVYLDGKKVGRADSYIPERTHDNCIWHTYGLEPGRHVLEVVTHEGRHPRSAGNRFVLSEAVTYRGE
jgi:hypothetical protein